MGSSLKPRMTPLIEDSSVERLRNVPERHLEVVSELGEM